MTVALGICTFERPSFFDKVARGVAQHLGDVVDHVFVYNDGSAPKFNGEYGRAYKRLPNATITVADQNRGVGHAKNHLLRSMLETDASWLFLIEDDNVPQSAEAVTGYVAACEESGHGVLSFAHHGDGNRGKNPIDITPPVATWPAYVGSWQVQSRECVETVGLLDPFYVNAIEHLEWWFRAFEAGYCTRLHCDVVGSDQWVTEIPGSIQKSSIRVRSDWSANIQRSLEHWYRTSPSGFALMYGDDPSHIFGAMGMAVPSRD